MTEPFLGTWKLESSEHFEEYLGQLGVPITVRHLAALEKLTISISAHGDKVSIKTQTSFKNFEIFFKLGEEFNETMADNWKVKVLPASSTPGEGATNSRTPTPTGKIWQTPKPNVIAIMVNNRNESQIKEQETSTEDERNEVQLSKLTELEFRAMILRKLNSMCKDMSTMSKDIEMLKINQL
uniref:Fatty acid binding protein 9 n=1 Tax=Molossus molossus TaxID=27622 RepID=A0A7J8B7U0_MOLMO|nr:fatty acid binding protein 9 [Molossus molossus]